LAIVKDRGAPGVIECTHRLCRDLAASSRTPNPITALAWSPDDHKVVFKTRNEALQETLMWWSPDDGHAGVLYRADGKVWGGATLRESCEVGNAGVVCVTATPTRPPHLIYLRWDGSERDVFDPNEAFPMRAYPRVERLRWQNAEGVTFTGVLFLPEGADRNAGAPLFVNYYHCDGFVRGGEGDEWPFATMAAAGIAGLCINRTALDALDEPQDGEAQYRLGTSGVAAAIEVLERRGIVDPTRVGMGGLSFGSEVTLWTLWSSDLIAAASTASVVLSPTYYWFGSIQGPEFAQTLRTVWGLDSPEETPERWRAITPAPNAEAIKAPLLMQLPEQEFRSAMDLYVKLQRADRSVEMYVFPDSPHVKTQPRQRMAVYERNVDWFRFWLQGFESADPAKEGQYARWRAMRSRECESRSDGRASWYCRR
jgi:dipeptidyl aminopeptidase/acylaminoacyl peptidase